MEIIIPNCEQCANQGQYTYEDFMNHEGKCYYCTENKYNFQSLATTARENNES